MTKEEDGILQAKWQVQPSRGHQWKLHLTYLCVLAWFAICHLISMYIFSRGFLLSRVLSDEVSTSQSPVADSQNDAERTSGSNIGCWHPVAFERALILVVDALRYDFVAPVLVSDPQYNARYHNRLNAVHSKLRERGRNSLLYEAIADPPTTTLQRLTALTTGTLPTFVDAGSNFGGQAILEDNFIRQLHERDKKIAFVGDDTWLALYPSSSGYFNKNLTFPYPSFDVHDLHTVDNAVKSQVMDFLNFSNSTKTWDVAIGHMLGLDHAGHRYGTGHEAFTSKLDELNAFLEEIFEALDSKTLLILTGDHGMTANGDHGGESVLETNAALFVHSTVQQLTTPSIALSKVRGRRNLGQPLDRIPIGNAQLPNALSGLHAPEEQSKLVYQIDIVPTISLLLGLPIPFNNLGSIIPEFFFQTTWFPTMSQHKRTGYGHWESVVRAIRVNAHQIRRFVKDYLTKNSVSDQNILRFKQLDKDLLSAEESWKRVSRDDHIPDEIAIQVFKAFENYNRRVLYQARGIWAQFDARLMIAGILLMAASTVSSIAILKGSWPQVSQTVSSSPTMSRPLRFIFIGAIIGAIVGAITGQTLYHQPNMANLIGISFDGLQPFDIILPMTAAASLLGLWIGMLICTRRPTQNQGTAVQTTTFLLCGVMHAAIFFSNSFTIHEDKIIVYLAGTLLLCSFRTVLGSREPRLFKRGTFFCLTLWLLIRGTSFYRVCREEQGALCDVTFYVSNISSAPHGYVLLLNLLLAAYLVPATVHRTLEFSYSRGGFGLELAHGALRLIGLVGLVYWALDTYAQAFGIEERIAINNKMLMALLLLLFSTISICVWTSVSLLIDVTQHQTSSGDNRPVVLGWSNSLGAPLYLFHSILSLTLAFVQKPAGWLVVATSLGQLSCLLELTDILHDVKRLPQLQRKESSHEMINPPYFAISILALCSMGWFYATGHQATFTSIQWDSAFIGLNILVYPLGPILVILNTFGPFILAGACAPLLAVWNIFPQAGPDPPSSLLYRAFKASLALMTYFQVLLLTSALASALLRRHLMVWAIFAPRFMLAASSLIAVDSGCLFLGFGYASIVVFRKNRIFFGTEYM